MADCAEEAEDEQETAMKRSIRAASFVVGIVLCGIAWKLFGPVAGTIVVGIGIAGAYRHTRSRNQAFGQSPELLQLGVFRLSTDRKKKQRFHNLRPQPEQKAPL